MHNINQPAFAPEGGLTKNLSVTGSTGNVQWRTGSASSGASAHCRVYNSSATVIVFIKFGSSNTVTASTTADVPIPPGQVEIFSADGDWVAAIGSAAGPTTVYFTPGHGI